MSKFKKIISLLVFALFLSAITLNFQSRNNQIVSTANADIDPCPGWDGYSAFCAWVNEDPNNPCQIEAHCFEVCLNGC